MNITVLRLLLTRWSVYARQILVLATVFIVSGLFVSLNNYDIVSAVDWYRNLNSPFVGKVPIDLQEGFDVQPLPAFLEEYAKIAAIEINGVTVSKPNFADPGYAQYAKSTNVLIAPEHLFADIVGAGNILKLLPSSDLTRRGAWLDYNTAKKIRCNVGDLIWIPSWERNGQSQMILFEFEIRGIVKPFINIITPINDSFPFDGIVLLEESHITGQYLSTIPGQHDRVGVRGAYFHILLSSRPGKNNGCVVLSKSEAVKAGLTQVWSELTGFLVLVISAIILILLVNYRETSRVLNSSMYPASLLVSLGVSTASIKKHFLFLQYTCFATASLMSLLGLKYFLFHFMLGRYFGPGLIILNIIFWGLIFSISLLTNRHVACMNSLNITTLDEKRGN